MATHATHTHRLRYVWADREGPSFTLAGEEKELEQLERRRLGLQRKYHHYIENMHTYLEQNKNAVGFTWADEVRVEKEIAGAERDRLQMEDRYAELISRQRTAVERRRASLVAFGMLGLARNQKHMLHHPTELADLILRIARG